MTKLEGQTLRRRRAIGGGIATATAGAVILASALVPTAANALDGADPSDPSAASGRILNIGTSLLGGLDVAALGNTITSNPSAPGTPAGDTGSLDVSAINGLVSIDLGELHLPLLSDGTNNGLLDLGDAGALSSYSISPSTTSSTASAGVVTESGAIDLGAVEANTNPAHLELTDLLDQLGLAGLTDQIVDQAAIEIGALAARAEKNGTTLESEYAIADLGLQLHSPLVGDLSSTLTTAVSDIVAPIDGIVGEGGLLSGVLGQLSTIVDSVNLLLVRLNSDPTKSTVEINGLDTLVNGVVADVLGGPISNTNGSVVLDLSTGTISVDLAELVIGDNGLDPGNLENLNGLPANTEVLTADVVSAVTAGVTEALVGAGPDSLMTKLTTLLDQRLWNDVSIKVGINASGEVNALLGWVPLAEAAVNIEGTLAQFTGKNGATLTADNISTTLNLLGVLPVGDLLNPIVAPLLGVITSNVTGPLLDLVTGQVLGNVQSIIQNTVIEGAVAPLLSVLEPLLEQLVSLRINEQPTEGDFGPGSSTVRALSFTLLPALAAVKVDLASATVKSLDAAAAPSVDALDPVQAGTDLSVTGTDWIPGSQVTLVLRDADDQVVGTQVVLTVEPDGTFPAGTAYPIPADAPAGTGYVLTATDDQQPANTDTDTVEITEAGDPGDVNTNAAASASASADATADADPAAQVAAQAAALANNESDASAAADVSAQAAAETAATADASSEASASSTSEANAQAAVAAQAAAQADADDDVNASAQAAANANSSTAAQAAAIADSSTDASQEASANANAAASASASANADASTAAVAQAAAQAAAYSDDDASASAAATAAANAAAQSAATADSSTAATADATSEANAGAAIAAQAAALADATSDSEAGSSATSDASTSAAANASAAAIASASTDASADAVASATAAADPGASAQADPGASAQADPGASAQADPGASTQASADTSAEVNTNASASAAASAQADDDNNAAAQAAAVAAALADATTQATAAATANANAAAAAAATADVDDDASATASTDATTDTNARAAAAAQSSAEADSSASASAQANANASAAASAAANANASTEASAAAAADVDAAASADAAAEPTGKLGLTIKHPRLEVSQQQTAVGTGFAPGEVVTGVMNSDPLALGTQVADDQGTVTFTWAIPAGTDLGTHTVTLSGESGTVAGTFQVVASSSGLAATGGTLPNGWIILGALLVMFGLGAALLGRPRRAGTVAE